MARFKDTEQNEWGIHIDGPSIMRIREEVDPDFLLNDFTTDKPNTFTRLQGDPVLLCRVIYELTEKERKERGISEEAFYLRVMGNAIDRASDALMEAIVNFSPGTTQEVLRAVAKQNELQQQAMARVAEKLNNPALMTEVLDRLEAEVDANLSKILTQLQNATSSPASAESTLQD